MIKYVSTTIVTDAAGDATVYVGGALRGRVIAIKYAPGTIATGADLTISGEITGVPILVKANAGTSTVWFYPVAQLNLNTDGSAIDYNHMYINLVDERVKVVVAQGGDTKTGTITVFYETAENL